MICKKCNLEKEAPDFYSGRTSCKECHKKWRQTYYEENKQEQLEKMKEYSCSNREKIKSYHKEYHRAYYEKNKEKIREAVDLYQKENKEKVKNTRRNYQNKKRKEDPKYRLRLVVSTAVYKALKKRGSSKAKNVENMLGYTIRELVEHLESLFTPEMTWENYGTYWHIDHIRPDSWFNYESSDSVDFRICWSLKNLQPLPAKNNLSKGNRFEG